MMTSHLCAASVLRTKPGAWGYQLYDRPFPSLSANNSASLFSKPSPLSVENGMLFGSAQTRSIFGSISSIDKSGRSTACASSFPDRNVAAATAAQGTYKLSRNQPALTELIIDLFRSTLGCGAILAFPFDASGAPESRPEEIDNEFRQRRLVAAELVRSLRSGRGGYIPIGKTARASRGAARFVD